MNGFTKYLLFSIMLCAAGLAAPAQTVGKLYGMTYSGGVGGIGTLFSFDPLTGKDTILINFNGTNGDNPLGNLMQAQNGLLYGMTTSGGNSGTGVLFYYDILAGKDSVILSFNGPNGASPTGTLVQASDGKLYGVSRSGGTYNDGVLFYYNPVTGKDSVLLNFNDTNGKNPVGQLVQASTGVLYGMTQSGGSAANGVLYGYNPITHSDTVYYNFDYTHGSNANNSYNGSLIVDTNQNLYGMTFQGGTGTAGVVFSHNPVTLKDTFDINISPANGISHFGGLIEAKNGYLYGLQGQGGANGVGTLFRYNTSTWQDTLLVTFNNTTEHSPYGTPIQASDGKLYAMTLLGGTSNAGTLFSYDINTNKDTVLVNFNNTNGASPFGDLLEAMSISITGNDTLNCYGDSTGWVKINVRGNRGPVTYVWSNGATIDSLGNLKGGLYTCIISDSGGRTFNVKVNVYQPAQFLANAGVNNVCSGNNATAWVNPTGGTMPYTYLWNNGSTKDSIFALSPGKDSCVITDAHGCKVKGMVTVANASVLKIDSIVTKPTSCTTCTNGTATVYVSGGIPAGDSAYYIYVWTYGGDSATVHGVPVGYDAICITSPYGCGSVCDSGYVPASLLSLYAENKDMVVYPNPSNGIFTIQSPVVSRQLSVEVYNVLDEKVYSKSFSIQNSQFVIDLSNQPAGVYIMQLYSEQGMIAGKLIVQR